MVRALRKIFYVGSSFGLDLLLLGCLLLLRVHLLELEKCYAFRGTYCMHMHKMSIMNA
jgi:hypothetical protein